jgi:hypothetical protein
MKRSIVTGKAGENPAQSRYGVCVSQGKRISPNAVIEPVLDILDGFPIVA